MSDPDASMTGVILRRLDHIDTNIGDLHRKLDSKTDTMHQRITQESSTLHTRLNDEQTRRVRDEANISNLYGRVNWLYVIVGGIFISITGGIFAYVIGR